MLKIFESLHIITKKKKLRSTHIFIFDTNSHPPSCQSADLNLDRAIVKVRTEVHTAVEVLGEILVSWSVLVSYGAPAGFLFGEPSASCGINLVQYLYIPALLWLAPPQVCTYMQESHAYG